MDKITQSGQKLICDKRVHPAIRVGLFLASLFPLLAPYELLLKPRWENFLSLSFFISLLFSMVMAAVSLFIMFIALFAQNQHVCFDGDKSTLTYGWSDAVRAYRETVYRFAEISAPELVTQTWSDGPTSYDLQVKTGSGLEISFGDFKSREVAERYRVDLTEIMGLAFNGEPPARPLPFRFIP